MAGLFSRLKGKDSAKAKKKALEDQANSQPPKPQWTDAWARKTVEPEEIHELIRCCTEELKARALHHPFLLLPFRPTSDPSAVRTFVRHFFDSHQTLRGENLLQELRMTEPMVISGVAKWCWSRIQGGIVGWDAYELFKVGEIDSNMARDSFKTFIPISVENGARQRIIFDFFDLMAAIAAYGKNNGLGGRKLSRMAAWWAFEHKDTNKGFEGGYNSWLSAADATSHLFFAYLRSLSPEQNVGGISLLPMSLQKLLSETEYPPMRPDLMMSRTNKVVMIVDTVSPTPFALLRRANHFQYRDEDRALQEFSEYDDPVQALTEECRRVLKAISAANQSQVSSSKHSTSLRDASWSRFEDIGFASALEEDDEDDESALSQRRPQQGLRATPASGTTNLGRPTTPSWADFLSSGFLDDNPNRSTALLPPDKVLPPIDAQTRQRSSQSHRPRLESDRNLEPGELASITTFDLDDAFWWVWMSSLAPEETAERKAAFGRCAIIEATIRHGRWLVMEEMVAGAAPEPEEGAYIAEKKGFFSWTRRSKTLARRKSTGKRALDRGANGASKTSIGPDTHARIQAKAAQLRAAEHQEKQLASQHQYQRRGRSDQELMAEKTNSVLTLQPTIIGEASAAMKWAKKYDKGTIKDVYMANSNAGRGMTMSPVPSERTYGTNGHTETNGGTHEYDLPPQVPAKEPPTAPLAPTPEPPQSPPAVPPTLSPVPKKEAERKPVPAPPVEQPAPPPNVREEVIIQPPERSEPEAPLSPVPPPKDDKPVEEIPSREAMVSPEPTPALSPESKKKKLHKENKENRGFRKLFGRKNRNSKLPANAAADVNAMLARDQPTPEPIVQQPTPAATPEPASTSAPTHLVPVQQDDLPTPTPAQEFVTPMEEPAEPAPPVPKAADVPEPTYEPTYEPSIEDHHPPAEPKDADAQEEFARFDQGPLADQPAFIPDSDDDDATPPPISRIPVPEAASQPPRESSKLPVAKQPEEKLSHSAGPGVQDRWARIRQNAAERAASRPSEGAAAHSKTTDGDEDTSGEETIESRVARIKARVAELTGNMEGTAAPQANANARR
ncbi:Fc.00g016800.m01.CDS01 [Cosmosporella sp. VM-42]